MNQGKLKIAFLHSANDLYTLERMKYFYEHKHQVYSISFSTKNYQTDIEGIHVIRLKKLIFDRFPLVKRLSHYCELNRILKQIKPDILHVVNALNLFYANTNHSKIKIVENQGSDVILTPLKYKFLIPYYKYYYKKIDGIIQDSKIARENGLKYGAPDNTKLNKIIEIGIDFNVFNKDVEKGIVRKKFGLEKRSIILYTRSIKDLYNIDIVLKSIINVRKVFPNCIYILTTDKDKLNSQLLDLIKNNDLERNILFVGFKDRKNDLKYFYRDADVSISVPSSDSSPFSVYESMACLTPNVVTDLPWLYYNKFTPGKHLLTCPVRNSEALAKEIINILSGNHKLDLISAYDIVFEKINLQKENEKLEIFYKYLLKFRSCSLRLHQYSIFNNIKKV